MFVFLRHGLSLEAWGARYDAGEAWDSTPYGYGSASGQFELSWAKDAAETKSARFRRRAIARLLGFDLVHAWRNRAAIRSADVVWTHTEHEHLAVALLLATSRSDAKLLAQSVWLWDRWNSFSALKRRLYSALLRRAEIEVLHSRLNVAVSRESVAGRPVALVPFGSAAVVDEERDFSLDRPSPSVVSAGSDEHRDWSLLARVASQLQEAQFTVFSSSRAARAIDWPENVSLVRSASILQMREAYLAADAVTLPLLPNLHASGTTVTIESMSSGRPLVVSAAGGLDDYSVGYGAYCVEAGDDAAFAAALRHVLAETWDPSRIASERRRKGLTQEDYVKRYELITQWMLEGGDLPVQVSRFESVLGA